MSRLAATIVMAVLAGPAMAEDAGPIAGPEPLADRAVAAHPSLDMLRTRAESLRARAAVAGSWSDPMISLELSNLPVDSWSPSAHPMSGIQVRAEQPLHAPNWSQHQRRLGELRATGVDAQVAEAELELRTTVARLWWLLVRTRALGRLTDEHLALTDELLVVVRSRYETGAVGQHALLRLQVLRDRLSDERADFAQTEAELRAALVEALGGEAVPDLALPAQISPLAVPSKRDWRGIAEANHPGLSRLDADLQLAEQAAVVARSDGRPPIKVWAAYRLRTIDTATDLGTDMVSLGVGVPIPVGSGRLARGEARAALAEAQAVGYARTAALDRIDAQVTGALARWERAATKVRTYDDTVLTGARSALDTTRNDFTVGRAPFASLFEAEVALLDLQRARLTAAVETHLQATRVTGLVGRSPLEAP